MGELLFGVVIIVFGNGYEVCLIFFDDVDKFV